MANLFSVTAPLAWHLPEGERRLVVAAFPHRQGVILLEAFWPERGLEEAVHLVRGALKGEGPWRLGGHRLEVAGCRGSDPWIAAEVARWREWLAANPYPSREQLAVLGRRMGGSS